MTYFVEIAHANDIINNGWITVDTLEDERDIPSYIQSPTFEWTHGTIVRIGSYVGAFTDSCCIDISADSEALARYSWNGYSRGPFVNPEYNNQDLVSLWHECVNATDMLYFTRRALPHEVLIRTGCTLLRSLFPMGINERQLVDKIEQNPLDYDGIKRLRRAIDEDASIPYDPITDKITHFARVCSINPEKTIVADTIDQLIPLLRVNYSATQKILADKVRSIVPFLTVVEAYVLTPNSSS